MASGSQLRHDIETAINRANAESGSNTPDFILAEFLTACLKSFDDAVKMRDQWYGMKLALDTNTPAVEKPREDTTPIEDAF